MRMASPGWVRSEPVWPLGGKRSGRPWSRPGPRGVRHARVAHFGRLPFPIFRMSTAFRNGYGSCEVVAEAADLDRQQSDERAGQAVRQLDREPSKAEADPAVEQGMG